MRWNEETLLVSSLIPQERKVAADMAACQGGFSSFWAPLGTAVGSLQQLDAEQCSSVAAAAPDGLAVRLPACDVKLCALPGDLAPSASAEPEELSTFSACSMFC